MVRQKENIDFAVARITETEGSTPRKTGAVMIMTVDGRRRGTVGGGLLEAETERLCRQVLETKEGITYAFVLDEKQDAENALEMGCGGDVTVQIEYVENGDPGEFLEVYRPGNEAYIFGGGHVAFALEQLLRQVDFNTTVIDDRKEYSNPERFPNAKRTIVCETFDSCFDEIETDDESYIVILTRGHKGDLQVLRQALEKPHAYLGMIGSRRKNEMLYEQLRAEGVSQEKINEIYAPIGIEIESETPEEIAVSIAAEMILVRAQKRRA